MEQQGTLGLKEGKKTSSVEEYKFDPIKGYPMLHWKGKRPFNATHYYPAQLKETYGTETNGWINKILWGDNLQVMSHLLKEYRSQVDFVYIDPPFDSKADYKKKIRLKNKEVTNDKTAFEEKQYTDIWSNDEYLQYMYERIILLRELLSDEGSIYVHCDHRVVSYLKIIMDELFGKENFRNLISWKRTSAHNDTGRYGANTDYILYYTKSQKFIWNQQYEPYSEEYLERFKRTDEDGRKWTDGPLTAKGLSGGGYEYTYKGKHDLWRCPLSTMERLDSEGKLYITKTGGLRIKRYLDEIYGIPLQSIWTDIFPVNSQAEERNDYPTQKPELLIERMMATSSHPGSLVFDCFMGSGTTQAVALKTGRRFIGADINLGAIQTTTKRLLGVAKELKAKQQESEDDSVSMASVSAGTFGSGEHSCLQPFCTGFEVYNVNHYDMFRNPVEAKDLLIKALEIQPLPNNSLYDGEKDGRMVKIMPVNRIATRADLNELITGFDYKAFEKRNDENPGKAVESILLVCMGHEPDLAAHLHNEVPFKLNIEVVDILRDKSNLEFKRDSEAEITIEGGNLFIREFYPMNLLQKLSLMKENVEDWRELTESVMVDFNYDGAVFEPTVVDVPEKNELVSGIYPVPADSGMIRVKITDLLSESLEVTING